jgi:hypothetical protein
MKPLHELAGVYLIKCLANGKTYTGSSRRVEERLQLHVSLLRIGLSPTKHMQRDWDKHGEDAFEFLWCNKPIDEILHWEEKITMLTDSLDDHGGYNRMLSNGAWSPSSRARNTEAKLHRSRKFSYLPGVIRSHRLDAEYVRSFCQDSTPFVELEPRLFETVDGPTAKTELLTAFEGHLRFQPRRSLRHG